MEQMTEQRIRELVSKFNLLRTKEGSQEFDNEWHSLMAEIPMDERKEAGRILREEMMSKRIKRSDVNMREVLGSLAEALNMSYISREYFHKDKSWFAQRMNGNVVNGKVSAFTDEELDLFRSALEDIRNRLSETISNITKG